MAGHVAALLACIVALSALATAVHSIQPYEEESLHPLALNCMQAIQAGDFPTAHSLFDMIKEEGFLDSSAFHLAAVIKDEISYEISPDAQNHLELLKEKLPISVKTIVFASVFCILNLERNEYMFSPNNDFIHDPDSRNVFLWRLGGKVDGVEWTVNDTLTPTDFKIINKYGEYLFADDSHTYLNRRNVYTYLRSEWTGVPSNIWRFKTIGDDVIVQNTWYAGGGDLKEYLYAAVNLYSYDSSRGRAFGWDKDWGSDAAHIWRLEAC